MGVRCVSKCLTLSGHMLAGANSAGARTKMPSKDAPAAMPMANAFGFCIAWGLPPSHSATELHCYTTIYIYIPILGWRPIKLPSRATSSAWHCVSPHFDDQDDSLVVWVSSGSGHSSPTPRSDHPYTRGT